MTTPNKAWMPLHDAAQALRVSVRTLQRRITDGTVEARKEQGRVMVCVPITALPVEVAAAQTLQTHADAHEQQSAALAQQVAALARVIDQQAQQVAFLREASTATVRGWRVAAVALFAVGATLGAVGAVVIANGSAGVTTGQPDDTALQVQSRAGQVVVTDATPADDWLGVPFLMPE
jgi:hypothetical protein